MAENQALEQAAWDVFKKLEDKAWLEKTYNIRDRKDYYGYHISYSTRESWQGNPRFLILTLNPQANETKKPEDAGRKKSRKKELEWKAPAGSPWPAECDFFSGEIFPIKKRVQACCYELARCGLAPGFRDSDPVETAKKFVSRDAILASFVPFRTQSGEVEKNPSTRRKKAGAPARKDAPDAKEKSTFITWGMWEFARHEYWGRILEVWQPEVIVCIGKKHYDELYRMLKRKCARSSPRHSRYIAQWPGEEGGVLRSVWPEKSTGKQGAGKTEELCTHNIYDYSFHDDGKGARITLMGLTHFGGTAPGGPAEKGLPVKFPGDTRPGSPIRSLFEELVMNKAK